MRIYPDTPNERGRTVARDALILLALFVLAWLALKVHDTVDKLAVLGTGVRDSGNAVEDGFGAAADAVSGVPVVGGDFGDALRDAGAGTGGNVADAGTAGEERIHDLANLLGFLFFAIPASILLLTTLPARIRQLRELNAAKRFLGEPDHRGTPPPDSDESSLLPPGKRAGALHQGSARRSRARPLRRTDSSCLRSRGSTKSLTPPASDAHGRLGDRAGGAGRQGTSSTPRRHRPSSPPRPLAG